MKLTPIDPAASHAHSLLTKHAIDRLRISDQYSRASNATHVQQVIRDLQESTGLEEMMDLLCDAILFANERSYQLQSTVSKLAEADGWADHYAVQKLLNELPVQD